MNRMRRKPRGGALLICVLVCLLVASAMVTATTRSALQSRRNVRLQHQMRQTELLLDAGVLLGALRQLQLSDQYEGETWRPSDSVVRYDNPSVEIRVLTDEDKNDSRRVEVIANLGAPDDPGRTNATRTQRTHTFSIELSEISPTPQSSTAE